LVILDGYLADRKGDVIGYTTLESNAKALKRFLGDLAPAHLVKERIRFYSRQRAAEGHVVGPACGGHRANRDRARRQAGVLSQDGHAGRGTTRRPARYHATRSRAFGRHMDGN
jgi:hypothetical protein